MQLTIRQTEGLKIAVARYKTKEKYVTIAGYAGSGKSTLVRFIINALDVEEDKVCYCAFTGKAAEVLRKKGNKNVCTLHKLLYDHVPRPAGGFFRKPKPVIPFDIVVVDEVSMAPKELMNLLFTHPVYVICLGDPFQLPPIEKEDDNILVNGTLVMDRDKKLVKVDGEPVKLTPTEYNILELLMENAGKVFSSSEIYEKIWGEDAYATDNIVSVHIRRIREKIEINPKNPDYLKVMWGVGYHIEKK